MPVPAPEHELHQYFDLSLDLNCVCGFDGYLRRWNAEFQGVLGYSSEELESRVFVEFVHPDDVERSRDALAQLTAGQDLVRFENRLVCADGSVRRFEWNARSMPHLGVVYGSARDVTERAALTEQQAALRRLATLVAHVPSPEEVFAAVVEETWRLVGVESTAMLRYDDDGTGTLLATWGEIPAPIAIGTRFPLEGDNITSRVFRTARPARIDHYADANGAIADTSKARGVRSGAGAPIIVDGRLWGVMLAAAAKPLPADTESRMEEFTELVATALANIDARAELTASRARIVAAADAERRRVVRDLHDGAQQRLVHTVITLKLAQRALEHDARNASSLVGDALDQAQRATHELRELAHGILPAALTLHGLRGGVEALASRMPVPVAVEITAERLPATVEATAYFFVAEALTNVAKHAHATSAAVAACADDGTLRVEVRDDGVGGVRPEGSGLRGLGDRLAALDGRLHVESPAGGGTLVTAAIPVPAPTSKR